MAWISGGGEATHPQAPAQVGFRLAAMHRFASRRELELLFLTNSSTFLEVDPAR